VVEFYNEGGGANEFAANKTKLLKPLKLSEKEIEDLVAFIESLSGPAIKMAAPKLPPYAPLPAKMN
jgi:cytochrome c peroxidase